MTKERKFKRRVRERMSKTGERYAAARGRVAQKRDRVRSARARLATASDRPSDDNVRDATGKRWEAWFSILDRWGARERSNGETVAFLVEKYGLSSWWAQTVTVWYLRARGMRLKHQQKDGFTIYATKTIAVPLEVLFDAFVNPRSRRKWLTERMTLRASRPGRTARFGWGDGSTHVSVSFERKGPAKATVAVAHERLPDPDEAETAKASWRERLAGLKSHLEA